MSTITRAKLTRADLALWNGVTASYTRADASGGTVSGLAIGDAVDVLQVYGAGTTQSNTSIASAISALGSRNVTIIFAPGTWSIEDNVTIPSNIVSVVPAGCLFDIDAGKTLAFNGPVVQYASSPSTGSGTVVGLHSEGAMYGAFIRDTAAETAAGVTVKNRSFPPLDIRRYGALTSASNNATAVQAAFDVAAEGGGLVVIPDGDYTCGTVVWDASGAGIIFYGNLVAHSSIPATGGIIVSLAGHADDSATNQALLDGIYGASVVLVRSNVVGSLENVKFIGCGGGLRGATNAVKGIWATGFTRGCKIDGLYLDTLKDYGIAINGSWSFEILNCYGEGSGGAGVGIGLGITGNGTRSATVVCNAVTLLNNEMTEFLTGFTWNFGVGGNVAGNISEGNVTGWTSQSVDAVKFMGNYVELNTGRNLSLGGTNGTDVCTAWTIQSNHFNNTSAGGDNFRMHGLANCKIGPNNYSGTRTQLYTIPTGIGQYITGCDIEIPDIDGTYVGNPDELNAANNYVHQGSHNKFVNVENADFTFTIASPAQITKKESGAAGETWTIPANSSVAFPVHTELEGINVGGGTLTIAITSDTLQLAGGTSTGSRTVADGGWFRIKKIASTTWLIEGLGVT